MTPNQPQPQEYIITEAGMNQAVAVLKANHLYDAAEEMLKEIRPPSCHSQQEQSKLFELVAWIEAESASLDEQCNNEQNIVIAAGYAARAGQCNQIIKWINDLPGMFDLAEHDVAIRKEEREKVLNELSSKNDNYIKNMHRQAFDSYERGLIDANIGFSCMLSVWIQSLRAGDE